MTILISQDYKEPGDNKGSRKKPQTKELRSGGLFGQYHLRGSILVIQDTRDALSGFIAFGNNIATVPTSTTPTPVNATGLLINYLGITSWRSGVLQTSMQSSDGSFLAGGGVVLLDVDGLTLDDANVDAALIKWKSGTDLTATIGTYSTAGVAKLTLQVNEDAAFADGRFHVNVYDDTGADTLFRMIAISGGNHYLEMGRTGGGLDGLIIGNLGVPDAMLDVRGSLQVRSVVTPAQITADQDNYNPTGLGTAFVLRLDTDASRNISGLMAQTNGRIVAICNVGANNIVLFNLAAGLSDAANQFALNGDQTLAPNESCILQYDGSSSRWRMLART